MAFASGPIAAHNPGKNQLSSLACHTPDCLHSSTLHWASGVQLPNCGERGKVLETFPVHALPDGWLWRPSGQSCSPSHPQLQKLFHGSKQT